MRTIRHYADKAAAAAAIFTVRQQMRPRRAWSPEQEQAAEDYLDGLAKAQWEKSGAE